MAKRARNEAADNLYNARKRYWRAAERNLDRAEKAVGMAADKYKRQAEQELRKAVATYDPTTNPERLSKNVKALAQKLNVDLTRELKQSRELSDTEKASTISASFRHLETRLSDDDVRREQAARTILSNPTIGNRIYGGLVDVWKDKATVWDAEEQKYKVDTNKINDLLVDYFQVDNIADVLVKLEESIGERLYDIDEERANIYEVVKLMIQSKVAENSFVQ